MSMINWDKTRKDLTPKKAGKYSSYREFLQKSQEAQDAYQQREQSFQQMESGLKQTLIKSVLSGEKIRVKQPIAYYSEQIQNMSNGLGTFKLEKAQLNPGEELEFIEHNKQLNTLAFRKSDGEEIELHLTPKVVIQEGAMPVDNPAYRGILLNTDVYDRYLQEMGGDEESA